MGAHIEPYCAQPSESCDDLFADARKQPRFFSRLVHDFCLHQDCPHTFPIKT